MKAMNGKNYRILVVDDETHNIDVLDDILSPVCEILVAKNGQTALNMAEEFIPDLILLDVIMPGMSGFEVIEELKRSDVTKRIPVIFITGLDSHKDEEKGLSLGAADYITKPFRNSIVIARVETQLQMIDYIKTIESMVDVLKNELDYIVKELVPLAQANMTQKAETVPTIPTTPPPEQREPMHNEIESTNTIKKLIEDNDFVEAMKKLIKLKRIYNKEDML